MLGAEGVPGGGMGGGGGTYLLFVLAIFPLTAHPFRNAGTGYHDHPSYVEDDDTDMSAPPSHTHTTLLY